MLMSAAFMWLFDDCGHHDWCENSCMICCVFYLGDDHRVMVGLTRVMLNVHSDQFSGWFDRR